MPVQRTPGPIGLETEVFPCPGGPWEIWPRTQALPVGPADDATELPTPVGLPYQSEGAADDEGGDESSGPRERFRYVEIQDQIVRIRAPVLWQAKFVGLAAGSDEDPQSLQTLVTQVKSYQGNLRDRIVEFLVQHLESEERSASPTAAALASLGGGRAPQDTDLESTETGRMVANG
jgi:hypothetical protein